MSRLTYALALTLTSVSVAHAEAPTAEALATKVEANYHGFGGQIVQVKMTLADSHGTDRVYELTEFDHETESGRRFMLLRFSKPETHAGTALLIRESADEGGEDEVYLYLASTGQLNRMSGSERKTRFLGSEIDIEQFTFPRAKDYHFSVEGEASSEEGRPCWNLVQRPKATGSAYSKVVSCVDKETYALLEMRYYDRASVEIKRMIATGYKAYGKQWRPEKMVIENRQTGRKTVFETSGYKLGVKLSDRLFSVAQLRKR